MPSGFKHRHVVFLIVVSIFVIGIWYLKGIDDNDALKTQMSFEECKAAGNLVLQGSPPRCISADGSIIEAAYEDPEVSRQSTASSTKPIYSDATDDDIRVELPFPNASTGTDFVVRGSARPSWFYKNSFPILLFNAEGEKIAEGAAEVTTTIDKDGRLLFSGPIRLETVYEGPALLVLLKGADTEPAENHPHLFFPITIDP